MEMTTAVLETIMGDAQVEDHVLQLGFRAVLSGRALSPGESPVDVLSPDSFPSKLGSLSKNISSPSPTPFHFS